MYLFVFLPIVLAIYAVSINDSTEQTAEPTASQQTKTVNPPTKEELLRLVNVERAKHGVAPLVEDVRLDQSAQRKSDDELKYGYFGHISPHDSKHGYEYINDVGINCKTDGENLTENIHDNTAQAAVTAWIKSPPHHAAMIDADYTLTGFGISGTEVVEHFCQT